MKLTECTHFKVRGQWFFVSAHIKENFIKAFRPHIKEALLLNGESVGSAMWWPEPIKLYYPTDLVKFCMDNDLKEDMAKAFEEEELKNIRAKLLIKQVKGPSNGIRIR